MNNMKKQKLVEVREAKGFTQQEIAAKLNMDDSCYSRRENGQIKIRIDQWVELARILNVPLEDIYDEDDRQTFICNDNATGYWGTIHINSMQDLLEIQKKYIRKLEEEIADLKRIIKENK